VKLPAVATPILKKLFFQKSFFYLAGGKEFMTNAENKVVVVTGAANGLGKALSVAFHRQGYCLALIDIDLPGLERLKASQLNDNQKITIHEADVSSEEAVRAARLAIIEQHQRIDILVNNAGVSISQPFDQVALEDFRLLIAVNFFGTVYCAKHFLGDLKKQDDSRLVNIISDFALMGFPGKTAYASSKSAIMGLTHCLKTELAGSPVKVCLVIPPPLDTDIVKRGKHISEDKKEREALFLQKNGQPLDQTAVRIIRQIRKGRFRIIIGTGMLWVDLMSRLFPTVVHSVIGRNRKRFDFV
jgi:NAD(P)-dependent dehydrogenase (short-subunit alcohol dehydrogenase family)